MTTLGAHPTQYISDVLRSLNAQRGWALRYKPFWDRLAKRAFSVFMKTLFERLCREMTMRVLGAQVGSVASCFSDILMDDGSSFAIRIARDAVLAGEIEREVARAGARLVSATGEGNGDSPADAFLRTVIDGASQYERGMIRARTRAALAAKRARRELVGAVPYGFALRGNGVHLMAARQEQATIARACDLRARGVSLRAVAAKLASEGRVSRRRRRFLPAQVALMLAARNGHV